MSSSSSSIRTLPQRPLGSQGLVVSAQGLGCMGMSAFYVTPDGAKENEAESLRVFDRCLELGLNFLDTSNIYGPFTNEELVGRAIKGRREKFIVATKFGIRPDAMQGGARMLDSSPKHVREQCEGSLKRLGTDYIDLYYQHRVDPSTPIEETMKELKKLYEEGKIRYIGLSEAGPDIIRRAHAIHPITCIQQEWSLWSRDLEEDLVPVCRELGIGIVAYSPLGRGFLTGTYQKPEDIAEGDWRKSQPRMQGEIGQANLKTVENVKKLAAKKGVTPAQIALAWVHHQGKDVFPIPGTKRVKFLEDNINSFFVELTGEDMDELNELSKNVQGGRYPSEAFTYHATKTQSV